VVKNEKSAEWKGALFRARRLYEARHGRDLTYSEIGVEVAKLLRRKAPVSKQQVASWFAGVVPNFSLGVALATVLETDPVALGLPGPVDVAERPAADVRAGLSDVTDAELDAAEDAAKREAEKRRRRRKKRGA
jgi:hypothetical protein